MSSRPPSNRGTAVPAEADEADEHPDPRAPFADAAHDSAQLRRARRRAAWLSVTLLAIAVALTIPVLVDPVEPGYQPFDDWVAAQAEQLRTTWSVGIAEALDLAGSTIVTVPVRILALVVLVARRRWSHAAVFLAAIVLSELCIGPLKAVVDRPRPPDSLVVTGGQSFPSGHAIAAAVTAFGLVIAFLPRGRRRVHWMIGASLLAGAMAGSRVLLGAHWATDTIAGVCIGVGIAVGVDIVAESSRTAAARHEAEAEPNTVSGASVEAGGRDFRA